MGAATAEDHAPVWLLGLDSRLQAALFVEAKQRNKLGVFWGRMLRTFFGGCCVDVAQLVAR